MTDWTDKELVDFHIRSAVAAAKRVGAPIRLSTFMARLRRRNPGLNIHPTYVLDQIVRVARDGDVAIEVDEDVA